MTVVPLSDEAIDAIGSAVFAKPGAQVPEAYSEFDKAGNKGTQLNFIFKMQMNR